MSRREMENCDIKSQIKSQILRFRRTTALEKWAKKEKPPEELRERVSQAMWFTDLELAIEIASSTKSVREAYKTAKAFSALLE